MTNRPMNLELLNQNDNDIAEVMHLATFQPSYVAQLSPAEQADWHAGLVDHLNSLRDSRTNLNRATWAH